MRRLTLCLGTFFRTNFAALASVVAALVIFGLSKKTGDMIWMIPVSSVHSQACRAPT